jgi:hypothetical protein
VAAQPDPAEDDWKPTRTMKIATSLAMAAGCVAGAVLALKVRPEGLEWYLDPTLWLLGGGTLGIVVAGVVAFAVIVTAQGRRPPPKDQGPGSR